MWAMSLAHSQGDPKGVGEEGWQLLTSKKSEKKARSISGPFNALTAADSTIHINGNTKPQEALFLQRRPSGSKIEPRMAGHIHDKPWSICLAPGRKENPHHVNAYHRVWVTDAGRVGRPYDGVFVEQSLGEPRRWNRARKREHYDKFRQELYDLKPHDELFAIRTNVKFWTHLRDQGMHSGGQEKLEYIPKRATGLHLKQSNYMDKFTNVKHAQMMLQTGRKDSKNQPDEWVVDTRSPFDTRLRDDVLRSDHETDKTVAQIGFGFHRPQNTRSCPQMGADYMHR